MLHRVDQKIDDGIQLQQVIHSLPFGVGAYTKGKDKGHEERTEEE